MTSTSDRRAGALLGLAIGDAAGWPAVRHRSQLLPPWTRRLRRELDVFAEKEQVTMVPVPFSLNQPVEPLRLGPSDDAEWAAWTAGQVLAARSADGTLTRTDVQHAWRAAALDGRTPRGRISVATAADSLVRGIDPPRTGHDNPHHFDDAAAVRAVAVGVAAASPADAVELAGWDAEVTNSGDGVAAARVMADLVARLIAGDAWPDAWANAATRLPADGLLTSTVERARRSCADVDAPADAVPELDALVDHVYSYGVAAAQTLPVAVALVDLLDRTGSRPLDAVTAALCLPSLADSAPALTGALAGAAAGAAALPASWVERCRTLAGCCAAELAGADLIDIAGDLNATPIRKDDS